MFNSGNPFLVLTGLSEAAPGYNRAFTVKLGSPLLSPTTNTLLTRCNRYTVAALLTSPESTAQAAAAAAGILIFLETVITDQNQKMALVEPPEPKMPHIVCIRKLLKTSTIMMGLSLARETGSISIPHQGLQAHTVSKHSTLTNNTATVTATAHDTYPSELWASLSHTQVCVFNTHKTVATTSKQDRCNICNKGACPAQTSVHTAGPC